MNILDTLRSGLATVNELSDIATQLGFPIVGDVAKLATTFASIGENVLNRVNEGEHVLSATDQDEIKGIVSSLQTKNDELNDYILKH